MQKFLAHFSALTVLFGASFVLAHAAEGQYENPTARGINVDNVPDLLLALVDLVFLIGVPIIVICIIYSGFLFVTAGDNESQIGKAKTVFMWTVIGALVFFGAKALSLALQSTVDALK